MAGAMQKKRARFSRVMLVAFFVALFQLSSAATSHTVGDSSAWSIPSPSTFYSTWAAKQLFQVGDSLVFNFASGAHTVAEVSKSDYDSCSATSPISTASTSPATMTLSTAGTHYYICTISGHCNAGQKLAITTTTSSTTSPSPSSSSSSPATSPASSTAAGGPSSTTAGAPPPSSGATFAAAGLVLPFLLVAAPFFF